jgi:opacity protein-like surface antigen
MKQIVKSNGLRRLAAGLVFLAAVIAAAQDSQSANQDATKAKPQPATAKKQKAKDAQGAPADQKGQKDQKADDKSADEAPVPDHKGPDFTLGYSNRDIRGNFRKFEQYATPPQGLFIDKILYDPYSSDLRYTGHFDVQTPFQDDYRLTGRVNVNWGQTILEASDSRNRFYTPSDFVIDGSERQIASALVSQKLNPGLAFTLRAKDDQQDQIFEAPYDPLHQRTRTWNAQLQGAVTPNGFASFGFTDERFYDRTGVLPDTHTTAWDLAYMHQVVPALDLEAGLKDDVIQQSGLSNSHVESYKLGGGYDLCDWGTLNFTWRGESLSLPNVDDAYVQRRNQEAARFNTQYKGWTAEFGYNESDQLRVRQDHTFVDSYTYRTFDGRIAGPLLPWLRFSARASRQNLQGDPVMETSDPLALYWRNTDSAQFKLDANWDYLDAYAIFALTDQSNDARSTDVRSKTVTLGGDYQVRPDLNLYIEMTDDWWSANSADPQAVQLGLFFPNSNVFLVGAAWNVNPAMTITASYDQFWTDNPNPLLLPDGNVKGQFVNTGITYRFKNGDELGLTFAPWHYEDKVDGLRDYDTALIMVTARIKF